MVGNQLTEDINLLAPGNTTVIQIYNFELHFWSSGNGILWRHISFMTSRITDNSMY